MPPNPLRGILRRTNDPLAARIRERTGCTVVAVERDQRILMEFPPSFALAPDDALYVCGNAEAVNLYYDEYPASRL